MQYTYNGIKLELQTRLSLMSSWNKILFHSVYQRIIDILAYTGEKIVYLAEFLYRESKWFTATKRNSLIVLGKWLGYTPYRKTGALGTLSLSADPTFNPLYTYVGKEVRIPRWHIFTDENNTLNTYCYENTFYRTGEIGSIEVPIKEGTPKQFLYIAKGEVDECIYTYSSNIDNSEVEVQIVDTDNNLLYTAEIVDNLYLINDTENYYCYIENSPNFDYIKVCFGDGITSKKLTLNERVLVKYADTLGDQGNITSQDVITKIKTPLFDEDNLAVTLYVTNDDAITGGSEIEGIESIRNNAPNIFQVGNILSSIANWTSVINSASYVNKSKVWTVESLGGSTTVSEQNIVYVTAVSNTGIDLTTSQKSDLLINFLTPKKSLTEIVSFEPLEKVYIRFDITAKLNNTPFSIMNENIIETLTNNYGILYTDFQTNVYESNAYKIIDSVDDIVYHETELYYLEKSVSITASNSKLLPSYTDTDTVILDDQNFLVEDSFEIWIRRKIAGEWEDPLQIGETSGVNITGLNGYAINGGFVSYDTNQYSFIVQDIADDITEAIYGVSDPGDSDPLGYILYISYKMEDGNTPPKQQNSIRLPYFYQITDIDENFIDTDLSYVS